MTRPICPQSQRFLSEAALTELGQKITAQLGWHYPLERQPDLKRGIESAARDLGFSDLESGVRELLKAPFSAHQIEVLAAYLTIGETYFWRESRALEAFADHVLPQILARRNGAPLRIWSAGCASGEEAYTLAMLICERLSKAQRTQVAVFASDINAISLEKARRGIYSDWSFRSLPANLKTRYFTARESGQWEVAPELRAMTRFSALNLAAETLEAPFNTSSFDAIFCRNVLIYFDENQITRILARFDRALLPDGWLVVGPSEAARVALGRFTRVAFSGATLFQKGRVQPDLAASRNSSASGPSQARVAAAKPRETALSFAAQSAPSSPQKALAIETSASPISAPISPRETLAPSLGEVRRAADAGDLDAALEGVEKLLLEDKLAAPLHFLCATILHGRRENDRALQALQCAIFLDSHFILAHFFLANIARETANPELARRSLETARRLLLCLGRDEVVPESDGMTAGQLLGAVEMALRGHQ